MSDQTNQTPAPIVKKAGSGIAVSFTAIGGALSFVLLWYLQYRGVKIETSDASMLQTAFTTLFTGSVMTLHDLINKICFNGEDVI